MVHSIGISGLEVECDNTASGPKIGEKTDTVGISPPGQMVYGELPNPLGGSGTSGRRVSTGGGRRVTSWLYGMECKYF
jgi:hypothetical protein